MFGKKKRRELIRRHAQKRNTSHASSRFDTSDIIQETELQLWRDGRDSLATEYSDVPLPYIRACTLGNSAKHHRFHSQAKRNSACDIPLENPTVGKGPDPSDEVEAQEIFDRLLLIVGAMSELDQRIYFLRFHCNLSFSQIEKELGLTRRQLVTRFSKFKEQIRARLEGATDE